jgi:hypothetical protein
MSDNWWTDYEQNKRLRGLEEDLTSVSASLASARSSQRRLHAELSKVRGSLEQRLDRLSKAFDAFVEISDLRVTLGLFDAQGRVRHQARQLIAAAGPAGELSDVDGYWLAPALAALRVAVDGVVDADALSLARARDAERAAVFHVLGTGLLGGRATVPPELLAEVLPVPGTTMPRHQRAVWTLAADGFFGPTGWELVRGRGTEFVRALPADERSAAVDALRALGTAGAQPTALPREFEGLGDVSSALAAAARLAALRTWVEEGLAGFPNEQAAEVDPQVGTALALLVDEGSPVEMPLLARERELRVVIEGSGADPSTWDNPVGRTADSLRTDANDAEHPGRRAAALRGCGDLVLAAAERLADAARADAPDQVQARTRQGVVTITADGVDQASVSRLRSRIDAIANVSGQRRVIAGVALALAVVFVGIAVLAGWGWALVAVGGPIVAAYQWRTDLGERRAAAENAATMRQNFADEIESRVEMFTEFRADLKKRQPAIDEDLKALREVLA